MHASLSGQYVETVDGLTALVSGGYFFDGSLITSLNEDEIRALVRQALASDIHSFCVCGVFSPCRPDQEQRVAEIIREESSDVFITLSHEIAGLGLIERENVSILNACLHPLAFRTMRALEQALPPGIPLFLTQNNGTLLSIDQCIRFPVLTFASGSTNSMIGAAHLTGIQNGIVIDVGGTSTDIGVIANGRPRQTFAKVYLVDDIRVNMSMPDVLSLPLGGGTIIHVDEDTGSICVGPDSVGYQLVTHALAFGGQTITGCGGGGEPYHTKLSCLEMLNTCNGVMRVIPPSSLHPSLDMAAIVGFMGAPTVSYEQLPSGNECLLAISTIEAYLSRKVTSVFCGEIGGANGLRGLLVAASKQVPCVDCDNMGRAFPRLDQKLSFIRGQSVTPTCLCDVHGRTVLYTQETIRDAQELEETLRKECTKMGLRGGLCLPPLTGDQVQKYTVHHSLSLAWFLGEAKFNNHNNVIQAVAQAGHGWIVISDGKVIGVERNTGSGFVRGHVIIDVEGKILTIDFQNENLVARFEDKVIASVPDLITLVEQDSGEPLSTETVKYGCRISVLVLPAPEAMTTLESLKYVGPRAFGYDHDYIPPSYHVPIKSVWDIYYNKPSISQ
ncbi:unnamed protein product [Rotaria sp. Silwood1]|nr:unnamed protein product [Rotaria sp. Silwood1]